VEPSAEASAKAETTAGTDNSKKEVGKKLEQKSADDPALHKKQDTEAKGATGKEESFAEWKAKNGMQKKSDNSNKEESFAEWKKKNGLQKKSDAKAEETPQGTPAAPAAAPAAAAGTTTEIHHHHHHDSGGGGFGGFSIGM